MSRLSEQQILSRARASSLENVKNLNFWGSDLYDISILRQMPNVEVLSLSVNNITSLKDFAHCPRLRELYLRKNNIRDINEIGCLKNLPKLRVLWLSDNPCADVEHYRMTVLKNLPKLTKLDTIVVEEAEILEATEKGKEIPIPEDTPVYLDFTATADQNPANGAKDDNPQTSTAESDNPESSHDNLVNETNKLRAQLGLKPLLLEDPQPNATAAMTTTNIQKKGLGTSSDPRNENILSAVLTLIQELDQTSLLTLRKEIDQQLQDLSKTDNDFKNRSAHMEEKEAITD